MAAAAAPAAEVATGGTAGAVVAKGFVAGALKLWSFLSSEEFTKEQKVQMEHVVQCYKSTIRDTIVDNPPEFSTDDGKPTLAMTARRFETSYWYDMIRRNESTTGNAILTTEVKDLIAIICSYQSGRSYGKVVGGKVKDPVNLMWEEFKNFLVVLGTVTTVTKKTLSAVQQRIYYIERLGDEKFFRKSLTGGDSRHNNTLLTLERVRKELNLRLLPLLEREFNTTCVRDRLGQLINKCKSTIGDLVRYMLYIYSDYSWNSEFNYGYLVAGDSPYCDVLLGKMLNTLVRSPSIRRGFDAVTYSTSDDEDDNHFLNKEGHPYFHPRFHHEKTKNSNDPEATSDWVSMIQIWGGQSGIHTQFRHRNALEPLITAIGLIEEFGAFTGVWRTAKDLAGAGGDFMIYGPGLEYIYNLVPSFGNLLVQLEECLSATNVFSDDQYLRALVKNNNKVFRQNTQMCRHHRFELREALDECIAMADEILLTAKKAKDPIKDTQERWELFINHSSQLLGRLGSLQIGSSVQLPPKRFSDIAREVVLKQDNDGMIDLESESGSDDSGAAGGEKEKKKKEKKKKDKDKEKKGGSEPSLLGDGSTGSQFPDTMVELPEKKEKSSVCSLM